MNLTHNRQEPDNHIPDKSSNHFNLMNLVKDLTTETITSGFHELNHTSHSEGLWHATVTRGTGTPPERSHVGTDHHYCLHCHWGTSLQIVTAHPSWKGKLESSGLGGWGVRRQEFRWGEQMRILHPKKTIVLILPGNLVRGPWEGTLCHLPITDSISFPFQSLLERCRCEEEIDGTPCNICLSSLLWCLCSTSLMLELGLCAGGWVDLKYSAKSWKFCPCVFHCTGVKILVSQSALDSSNFRWTCNSQVRRKSPPFPPDRCEGDFHDSWREAGRTWMSSLLWQPSACLPLATPFSRWRGAQAQCEQHSEFEEASLGYMKP